MKWLHIIGISGKATANIGVMFRKMGWFVTGTDLQFLPPASNIIEDNNIPYETSFNFKHLTKQHWEEKSGNEIDIQENPDLVIVIESASAKNKEYLFAKNKGLDVRPYSQVLGEYLVKDNSIVVVGTAGKTSTTTLITLVLKALNLDPSYMIGADVVDLNDSIENTNGNWSVIEGDEYHNKDLANGAKFLEYKAKYVVITNIGYEHIDVFPTKEDYVEEFRKLVLQVPEDGLIVGNKDDENVMKIVGDAKCKVVYFSEKEITPVETKLIGKFNQINFNTVSILFNELFEQGKLEVTKDELSEKLKNVFTNFKGVKKRLELLFHSDKLIIIDDFGVAPNRAKNSLDTVKESYQDFDKIIAVFEPNSGSRPKDENQFKEMYKDAFKNADEIIIPELSKFDTTIADENDFVKWLSELGYNTRSVNSSELVAQLSKLNSEEKTIIIFFSAYRLDSVAKELVKIKLA